jgi:hypothetical protein
MNYFTGIRNQVAEICQVAGSRQMVGLRVCNLLSAKFLQNATCYLLNETRSV